MNRGGESAPSLCYFSNEKERIFMLHPKMTERMVFDLNGVCRFLSHWMGRQKGEIQPMPVPLLLTMIFIQAVVLQIM